MSNNIFLTASRVKLRFVSIQGNLTVEDLWDIPLTTTRSGKASIENIGATLLQRQTDLAKVAGASILGSSTPSPELEKVNLQVNILREIAQIRQAENNAKTQAAAMASERARLDELIRQREGNELPLDELKQRRAQLG